MIDTKLLEILIRGLLRGGTYSLMALGLTLLYGVARIVNMSHGSLFMVSVYLYYIFSTLILGLNPWLALIVTILVMGVIGAVIQRLAINPVLGDDVALLVVTITIAVIIQALVIMFFGSSQTVTLINPMDFGYFNFYGVEISWTSVITFVSSLSLFALVALFISKTKIGKAMQALSQDREAAMLMGINTNRLYTLVMVLSAILASIAGFMYCVPTGSVVPSLWLPAITSAFAIVILGGLGSIKGSLIGSFVIGYSEIIIRNLHQEGFALMPLAPLFVMITVLIIRPKGLFGKRVEMED